jgi:hypothetical protein
VRDPELVTIEGEDDELAELMGIDEIDVPLVGKCSRLGLSGREMRYLNQKYPEYMGIWPILAKAAKVVVGGAAGWAKRAGSKSRRLKKKHEQERAANALAAKAKAGTLTPVDQAQIAQNPYYTKAAAAIGISPTTGGGFSIPGLPVDNKKLVQYALPAAAILAALLLLRR